MRNGGETDEECRAEDAAMAAKHKHIACRAMQVLAMQAGQEKSMCCVCVGHDCEAEPDSAFDAIGRHIEAVQAGQKPHSVELDYNHMETAAVINSVLFPKPQELRPCPWCPPYKGEIQIAWTGTYDVDGDEIPGDYFAQCGSCSCTGPMVPTAEEAARLWNASRPVEDALRERAEKAETEAAALRTNCRWYTDAELEILPWVERVKVLEARIAELEAARAWRPISEAPRDVSDVGYMVLLFGAYEGARLCPFIGYWNGREWIKQGHRWSEPTHWMPLPGGPEVGK